MKFTYNGNAFCINNYSVCVEGRIVGILCDNVLFEFEKGKTEWVSKKSVFEKKDDAIFGKIGEHKSNISVLQGVISDLSENPTRRERAMSEIERLSDEIEFLTSQLESEQEGF